MALTTEADVTELDVDALYRQHGAFIARCIERLGGRGAAVEDLLQETFIAAYRHRDEFDPARASPRTWLYGIAANMCRTHRRSLRRLFSFRTRWLTETDAHQSRPRAPDEQLAQRQRARGVRDLLEELPFKQREVFILYELEELDGETIARLLGVPAGTVSSRLHKARETFSSLARQRIHEEESV